MLSITTQADVRAWGLDYVGSCTLTMRLPVIRNKFGRKLHIKL